MSYNVEQATKAQIKYIEDKELPFFPPRDGICFACHRQIYADGGYTVESASSELITGCPWCHRSYCD
jgi:hypothetical protein